ncbi:MAG: flagellar motor protein MotB [Vicinamibacterales bacterium]
MANNQPVIIIKKVVHGKHPHHGGAWKVAYADFVTAMMAFFLVMWLVSQNPETKRSVAQYFRDPGAFAMGGSGVLPGSDSGTVGGGATEGAPSQAAQSKAVLEATAQHLKDTLATRFADVKDRIDIVVGDDGLLIELREAPDDGFFGSGSASAKPETVRVLTAIAAELQELPNKVAIEGHTDSQPYGTREGYGNWELSADRANAARRILQAQGLDSQKVEAIHGYADTRLRTPSTPLDAGNRRISIFVRRTEAARPVAGVPAGASAEKNANVAPTAERTAP